MQTNFKDIENHETGQMRSSLISLAADPSPVPNGGGSTRAQRGPSLLGTGMVLKAFSISMKRVWTHLSISGVIFVIIEKPVKPQ